ncbi:MAG TPA: phenylalanine--tRNA ligase subunit beta [Tenuifilaceae bacterium]|nr:phenylalanine--tRNA ligase subunit beta [Tenuifilaceae bacterium]
MKISYRWLKDYVDFSESPEELAQILTSIGLEVEWIEKIEAVRGGLKGVVVGEVKTCTKHPNADNLTLTTVDVGGAELLNIVCGAPNVAIGQKVPVATIGTTLYFNDQEITLKKTKIRGELSEGMICAEDELGLGSSHEGIMVLNPNATVGMPAADYFNLEDDYQLEIGLTPNRIDAASHFGVARDLAAYLGMRGKAKAIRPSVDGFKVDNNSLHIPIEIVNPEACPRYSGVTISNVEVGPSPQWLVKKLRAIGLNPINNVVDVTNFVLHEIGQPLHAFDADKIEGKKVIVKPLPANTPFITLDGMERKLHCEDLMICNASEGMCIAGVFGGTKSGVTEATKNIFLESAHFSPTWVRRTAKRHGLNTDASFRFERGSDPSITVWALKRAAMLIKEVAGGQISSDIIDVYPNKIEEGKVELSLDYVTRLVGKELPIETIRTILNLLDINIISENNGMLDLSIPTYRVDVTRPADVVEEILRIYGFNNVEFTERVNSTLSHSEYPEMHKVINLISVSLSGNGFNEIMCNSLTKKAYYKDLTTYPENNAAEIINPLSSDLNAMRQTLLFGGLESILFNINHRKPNLKLYEWGNCYRVCQENKSESNPLKAYSEELMLGIWLTGNINEESWLVKPEEVSFYHMKGFLNGIFHKLGISDGDISTAEAPNDLFEFGIKLMLNGKLLGHYGFVAEKILKEMDIKQTILYAEIRWDIAFNFARKAKVSFTEIAKYPEVRRDLALLLDIGITFDQIKDLAHKTERKLIKHINLFDVYQGAKLGEGKKSYAVSFTLQDENKTLTDKQIDGTMQRLIQVFVKELGAQIR